MDPAKPQPTTTWASGAAYEAYVGRWSRLVAHEFLAWLNIPPARRWLDAGCGAGALAETILQRAMPHTITGMDKSLGFIHHTHSRLADSRVRLLAGDLQDLPLADAAFDAAVSGLVLNFVADHPRAVLEMARVVRPGGIVALYVWDYAGKMELMRRFWEAAVAVNPAAAELDQGDRYPICQPEPLTELFQTMGLHDIEVRAIDIPTVFRSFDDYWLPFLGGQGAAPTYAMSLGEAERTALGEYLRATLPVSADGSIHLTARAWAVRGVV